MKKSLQLGGQDSNLYSSAVQHTDCFFSLSVTAAAHAVSPAVHLPSRRWMDFVYLIPAARGTSPFLLLSASSRLSGQASRRAVRGTPLCRGCGRL